MRIVLLMLVVACGPAQREVRGQDTPARSMDRFAEEGRFLGWTLGGAVEPGDRVEATEEAGTFVLGEPLSVAGRSFDEVLLRIEGGRLVSVTLRANVSSKTEATALERWVDRMCSPFTARLERQMPSPLGTPEEGEDWDPVEMSEGQCEGDAGGVHVALYEDQTWASDFHHGGVTVVLTPMMP